MAQPRTFSVASGSDSQMAQLKLPPHSIEAEQSLIGGLLLDNSAWDRIADIVAESRFLSRRPPPHLSVTSASWSRSAGRPTWSPCSSRSRRANEVDQTGGLAYLGEIANATPSAANIRRYAEIVRERAVLRKLVTVGDEIAASALNPAGRDAKQLLDEAEQQGVRDRRGGRQVRAGLRGRSRRCWARWWTASSSSTTARIPPTSPACPPASTTSTR